MAQLQTILKSRGYCKIPLRLSATGHLELEVLINGVPGHFLLDTGASNTCVALDRGSQFHLITQDSSVLAAGAGATDMATMISYNNVVEIAGWKKIRQQVVLLDLGHVNHALTLHEAKAVDGIIGADLLHRARAVIDYAAPSLYLWK